MLITTGNRGKSVISQRKSSQIPYLDAAFAYVALADAAFADISKWIAA